MLPEYEVAAEEDGDDKVEGPSDGESDKATMVPPDVRQASDRGMKGMRGRTGNEGDRRV